MEIFGKFKVILQTLVLLLLCSIFCVDCTNLKHSSKGISENQLKYVSIFHNCLLYLINFDGYDINLSVVPQPVVLLRYYSIANEFQIIPVELLKGKYNWNENLASNLDQKYKTSVNYLNLLLEGKLIMEGRKMQCEVTIYLHPPIEDESPNMYANVYWSKGRILKNPFWIEFNRSAWKRDLLNTMPKLSLLIC